LPRESFAPMCTTTREVCTEFVPPVTVCECVCAREGASRAQTAEARADSEVCLWVGVCDL